MQYNTKRKKTIKQKQRSKSKKNKTRQFGSGPKKGNVKFGENEIRVYDNTILPEETGEYAQDSGSIPSCPDFSRIRPSNFPCKYRRTIFENIDEYNEWVRLNIEKNRGVNPKQRFFQIRNHLAMMGQWKNRNRPIPVSVPMDSPHPPPISAHMPTILPAPAPAPRIDMAMSRFRPNVNPRIMEGLTEDVI